MIHAMPTNITMRQMRMRMSDLGRKILNALLAIDIGIILFCMLSGHRSWFYTTQIGFFSSALVIAASMTSYQRMIKKRLEYGAVSTEDERDELDKIDDPHALYGEDVNSEESSTEASADKAEEENKRSIPEVIRDAKAFLSFYRIGAYIVLILGFFYLNRHNYLHIPSYIFALSLPPVIVVIMLMRENKKISDEVKSQ